MADKAQSNEKPSSKGMGNRRSSFFNSRRLSFFRSKGTRGADVATLRGNTGATFEGYARVERCADYMKCCGMTFGSVEESTSKKPRFLLMKGTSLFIFVAEDTSSAQYAISLEQMQAEAEEETHGHTDVLLKTALGDVEYRFTFDMSKDKEIVPKFLTAIRDASGEAQVEEIKKRLGHGHQLNKRASEKYADQVAMEKVKDQPDTPINVTEAMTAASTMYPV